MAGLGSFLDRQSMNDSGQQISPRSAAWMTLGVLSAIAIAQAMANPWWILEPSSFAPIDDSYVYLSLLFKTFDGLASIRTPADLWHSLETLSVAGRPPLKQLLTLPLLAVFGRAEAVALTVNLGYTLLLVFSTYKLARHFSSRLAVLAAFVAATLPPIVWLSRMYVPYNTVPASVALVSWRCVELLRKRSAENVWWVGAATAFALLNHPHTTWFIALPAALAVVWSWLLGAAGPGPLSARAAKLLSEPYLWRGVVPTAALCGGAVLSWYLTIGYKLLGKLILLSDLESFRGAKVRAGGFPGIDASFWWYLRTAPATITNVLTLSALVGMALWLWQGPSHKRWLAICALCGYVAASLQNNLVWFVGAGLLPIVGVAAVTWLDRLRPRLRAVAVAAALLLGVTNYALTSFDLGDFGKALIRGLSYPVAMRRQAFLAQVPEAQRSAELEVLSRTAAALEEDPRCLARCGLMVTRTRAIGYARLEFYLIAHHPKLNVRVVNEGARAWGTQYRLSSLVGAEYLLYPDTRQVSESYHEVTVAFLNQPGSFAETHERVFTVDVPPAPRMTLIRRLRSLTAAEIENVIHELSLDERYLRPRFEILAGALLVEGNFQGAEDQLRRGLKELGPDAALANRGLQIVDGYLKENDLERAAAVAALLAEHFPDDPRVRQAVVRIQHESPSEGG